MINENVVKHAILALAKVRGTGKTICPSEVARSLCPENWRDLIPSVRAAASTMSEIEASQKGQPVDPLTAKGPIRLGFKP